jgi:hypothetical protein
MKYKMILGFCAFLFSFSGILAAGIHGQMTDNSAFAPDAVPTATPKAKRVPKPKPTASL